MFYSLEDSEVLNPDRVEPPQLILTQQQQTSVHNEIQPISDLKIKYQACCTAIVSILQTDQLYSNSKPRDNILLVVYIIQDVANAGCARFVGASQDIGSNNKCSCVVLSYLPYCSRPIVG